MDFYYLGLFIYITTAVISGLFGMSLCNIGEPRDYLNICGDDKNNFKIGLIFFTYHLSFLVGSAYLVMREVTIYSVFMISYTLFVIYKLRKRSLILVLKNTFPIAPP